MSHSISQKFNELYYSKKLIWILVGLGILLRLSRYLHNPSLWFDEAVIGADIINRSHSDFINPSPDWSSKHPFGFLVLVKLAVETFGTSEYALRLVPVVSGSISVVLFYKAIRNYVKHETMLISLSLFAFAGPLIYQASNVKPYSSDLAFALMIFWAALRMQSENLTNKRIMFAGLIGALIIWISHPSIFVLAGVGSALLWHYAKRKEYSAIGRLGIVLTIWAASFLADYFIYTSKLIDNIGFSTDLMLQYENAYIPFPPMSLTDIKFITDSFLGIFTFPIGLSFAGLASFAFLLGCISIYRRNSGFFMMLIAPVFMTLFASLLRKYPFNGRLIVFLVPFFLVFIAEGVEYVRERISNRSAVPSIILIFILLAGPVSWAAYHVKVPDSREEIKPVVKYIYDNWQTGDIIYVHYFSQYAFEYYTEMHPEKYSFPDDEVVIGIAPSGWYRTWRKNVFSKYYEDKSPMMQPAEEILRIYTRDLDRLKGHKRVWILFSSTIFKGGMQEEKFYLYHLDTIGERLDSFGKPGVAAVYLYNLSDKWKSESE